MEMVIIDAESIKFLLVVFAGLFIATVAFAFVTRSGKTAVIASLFGTVTMLAAIILRDADVIFLVGFRLIVCVVLSVLPNTDRE